MFFTAGALLYFFLLLSLALIQEATSSYSANQPHRSQSVEHQSTDIAVGSNLSANAAANSSWLSPSGRFSLGFYPKGKGFLVGIQLIINPKQPMVVWTARLDLQKPFSKAATLTFTADGFLLTPNSGQDLPFFLLNFSSPASSAAMLDNGNFEIYNSTNITWTSFDYPTDTILGSQSLLCGHNLTSAATGNNPSIEAHVLSMQCDGNLVVYPVNSSAAIWASVTSGYNYRSLVLDENGLLYLRNDLGSNKDLSGYNPQNVQANMIYAARLDADNIFRLYAVNLDTNTSTEVNDIPYYKNKCYDPEICGENSFCLVVNDAPKCQCVPGFTYIQASAESAGCQEHSVA